jgi:hypothetical protein
VPARRLPALGAVLLIVWLALVAVDGAPKGNINTGDSNILVRGTHVLGACLRARVFDGCEAAKLKDPPLIGPYPVIQYVPASILAAAGASDETTLKTLARLSFVSLVACLACALLLGRRFGDLVGATVAVATLCSSMSYQATAGFGEALVAAAVLATVTFAALRRRWATVGMALVASIGKETLPPFVVGLAVVAAWVAEGDIRPVIRRWLAPLIGAGVIGFAASAFFNVWRYGHPSNDIYLEPSHRAHGFARIAEGLGQLLLSPGSGVVLFWPIAVLILALAGVVGVRGLARRRPPIEWGPPLATLILTGGFLFGLALWFTPFGWITLGPRLAVPILPAAVAAAAIGCRDQIDAAVAWARRAGWRVVAVPAVLVALCWPAFGYPWSYADAVEVLITKSPGCPKLTGLVVEVDAKQFYRCADAVAWRVTPSPYAAAATKGGTTAVVARVLGSLAVTAIAIGLLAVPREPEATHLRPRRTEPARPRHQRLMLPD